METVEYTLKNITAIEKKANWNKYLVEYDEDTLRNVKLPSEDEDSDRDCVIINVSSK